MQRCYAWAHQDASAAAAADGASGRCRPHRPAGGPQPKTGAGGGEPISDGRAAERANAWGLPSSRRYRHVMRARTRSALLPAATPPKLPPPGDSTQRAEFASSRAVTRRWWPPAAGLVELVRDAA